MRKKLVTRVISETSTSHYIISENITDLTDILARLAGLYGMSSEFTPMLIYKCSMSGSLKIFRDFVKKMPEISK
jgi:hypothetical protein